MPFTPVPSSDICWNCADYLSVIFLSHSRLGAMDHAAATELNIFCTEMYSTSADCLASVRAWALRNYLSPAISADCLHRPFIQNRKRKWPSSLVFNLCQFGYAKVAIWIVWMENKWLNLALDLADESHVKILQLHDTDRTWLCHDTTVSDLARFTLSCREAVYEAFRTGNGTRDLMGPNGLTTEKFVERSGGSGGSGHSWTQVSEHNMVEVWEVLRCTWNQKEVSKAFILCW